MNVDTASLFAGWSEAGCDADDDCVPIGRGAAVRCESVVVELHAVAATAADSAAASRRLTG